MDDFVNEWLWTDLQLNLRWRPARIKRIGCFEADNRSDREARTPIAARCDASERGTAGGR